MALEITRIKALCFDVDGTLRDTDNQYVLYLEKYFRPFKFLHPKRDTKALTRRFVMDIEGIGNFIYSIPDWVGLDDEIATVGNWVYKQFSRKEAPRPILIIPGVHETLNILKEYFPMVVVTARAERGTMDFLRQHGLHEHFREIISAQTCARTKPHPDPILYAAEKMGVKPEECLMIGDTTVDIKAGVRAGAQTVGVLSGFGEEEELLRCGADHILGSVAELPALFS